MTLTLIDEFEQRWRTPDFAGREALVGAERTLTYEALADEVFALARVFSQIGIARGDLVALAMERSVQYAVTLLAIMAAGACPCPLEARLSADETARRIRAVGIAAMIHDAHNQASAASSGLAADRRWDIGALPAAAGATARPGSIDPSDPGLLLFTSGSTGHPKGVLQNHRGLRNNALGVAAHTGLTATDRLLHVMPLHHTNALNNQLFAPLCVGACVVLAGRFKAEEMPALLQTYRPTLITGVPTMYARMLDLSFDPQSLARLRFARCGSAPITPVLHRRIEAFLGCPLIVSYGLSEATCTSTMNPPAARRIGSVGTVLPNQRVILLGADDELLAPGQEGEICIEGDSLMMGYLGVDDGAAPNHGDGLDGGQETGSRAHPRPGSRAAGLPPLTRLRSGDLGRFDADGYLCITGRIKDVIIRGGENISPALIENALVACEDVAACCVVGAPDHDLGEVPVAFVVARAGCMPDADRLREAVKAALGRIYVPARIFIEDRLPENAVGKVDRKALARRLNPSPM